MGVYDLAIQTIYNSERKLKDRFHEKNVNANILPPSLEKVMRYQFSLWVYGVHITESDILRRMKHDL
jgi:hypothetical protein